MPSSAAAEHTRVPPHSADAHADLHERITELEREKLALETRLADVVAAHTKRARPKCLRGTTYRKHTPLGVAFINITEDDQGRPFEVFISLGKAGGSAMADAEALGRVISLALRMGIPLMQIHKQIRGISSDRAVGVGAAKVLSMPDAVAIALAEWHDERLQRAPEIAAAVPVAPPAAVREAETVLAGASTPPLASSFDAFHGACPDCGCSIVMESGCSHCTNTACGYSECG